MTDTLKTTLTAARDALEHITADGYVYEGSGEILAALEDHIQSQKVPEFLFSPVVPKVVAEEIFQALTRSGHLDLARQLADLAGANLSIEEKGLARRIHGAAEAGDVDAIDNDGVTEADSGAAVSIAEDPNGGYIQTWTWVSLNQ